MANEEASRHDLFTPGIITELQDNPARFIQAMKQFYEQQAQLHDCFITLSDRRLTHAYDLWAEDANRMFDESDEESSDLDHFKHASIIAFWLRRMVPINDVFFAAEHAAGRVPGGKAALEKVKASKKQADFANFGSERCALFVGFYLCLAYESQRRADAGDQAVILGEEPDRTGGLPPQFRHEFPILMKEKTISIHSLYMTYISLFSTTMWRVAEAVPD